MNEKSGLDYLMDVIAKLLNPAMSESASVFIGDVITKLLVKGGNYIRPIIPALLQAVAVRLENAKMPSLIQTLVIVFAHLIQDDQQMATVINFLADLRINGKDGLLIFLTAW